MAVLSSCAVFIESWQATVAAAGGLMVVPLNALLHRRGHQLLGAGAAIAVQGFFQNASVLLALSLYMLLLTLDQSMGRN
jgi:hypothetical protein